MSEDVGDDWENLLDSGELDQKLDDIKIESTTEVGVSLNEPNFSGPVRILTNDSRLLLSRTKQEPTMKILKRPESNVSKPTEEVPKAAPKSLSQREAEYAEARQRILGAEAASNSEKVAAVATSTTTTVSNKSSNNKASGGKQTQNSTAGSKNSNSNKQASIRNSSSSNPNSSKKNNSQMQYLPQQQPPVTPIFQPPPSHQGSHHHPANYMLHGSSGHVTSHPTMYPPPQLPAGPGVNGHHHYPLINGPMVHGNVVSNFSPQYPPPRGGSDAAATFYKVRR